MQKLCSALSVNPYIPKHDDYNHLESIFLSVKITVIKNEIYV